MSVCAQETLANPGACKFKINRIRRGFAVLTLDAAGDKNTITIANAGLIAQWQTLFNKWNFLTDAQSKVVVLPLSFDVESTVNNQGIFDQDTYITELFKGDTDFTFNLNDVDPSVIKALQDYETKSMSIWLVDENDGRDKGGGIGKRSGSNFDPFPLSYWSVANWNFPQGDVPSQIPGAMRFADSKDLNDAMKLLVYDASGNLINLTDDKTRENVWSLVDATLTSAVPATTGCTFTASLDNVYDADNETNKALTDSNIVFGDITFVDQSDGTLITLAGAGSLSYVSATGVFTVNEVALLTTLKTYKIQVALSKFDIVHSNTVIVP